MIIPIALTLLIPLGEADPFGANQWPLAMTESKIAKGSAYVQRLWAALQPRVAPSASSRNARKLAPDATTPKASVWSAPTMPAASQARGTHEMNAKALAYAAGIFAANDSALKLIDEGDIAGAKSLLERSLLKTPAQILALTLIDLEFYRGDYVSACKLAVPFVKAGRASQGMLVRASLAAAALGEVYPGQREFLVKIIQGKAAPSDWAKTICLAGNSPEVIAELSHVLLGDELGMQYRYKQAIQHYAAALEVDRGDPYICRGLGVYYYRTSEYTLAEKAAEAGLPRAGTRLIRIVLEQDVARYQSCMRTLGDGNPVVAQKPVRQEIIHP